MGLSCGKNKTARKKVLMKVDPFLFTHSHSYISCPINECGKNSALRVALVLLQSRKVLLHVKQFFSFNISPLRLSSFPIHSNLQVVFIYSLPSYRKQTNLFAVLDVCASSSFLHSPSFCPRTFPHTSLTTILT